MARHPLADDATLEVSSSTDVAGLDLTQNEGVLVSRLIGRRTSVSDVLQLSGLTEKETKATLAQLIIKGAVKVHSFGSSQLDGPPLPQTGEGDPVDEYSGMVFSPRDLNEPADITTEQKKRILWMESKLDDYSHYALLNLKRTASQSEVKRAYFKASKEFHPDAYFRKELGTFRVRVDKIFRRMKGAYDVLNNEKARKEYDDTLPADFTPAEQAELKRIAEEMAEKRKAEEREARQQARKKKRRLNRNPMTERLLKARKFMKMAEEARAVGRAAEAARHAKLAMEYAPGDASLKGKAEKVFSEANLERAQKLAKRAPALLTGMDKDEMCRAGEELAELGENDAEVLATAAELLLGGGRPQRGLKFAQKATGLDPKCKKAWEALFRLAEKTNSWNTAFRAGEALLKIEPKNGQYKDWMKMAKRMK